MTVLRCDFCGKDIDEMNIGGTVDIHNSHDGRLDNKTHYDVCRDCFVDVTHFIYKVQCANIRRRTNE